MHMTIKRTGSGSFAVEIKCFINGVETDITRTAPSMSEALHELSLLSLQLRGAAGISDVS